MNQKNTMFSNKNLRKLIWPLVIEQILSITVGMADVVMVSSAGEEAVSGVSLVDMINVLILNIFAALATGGAVVVSQYLGAKEEKKAQKSANQLVVIAFLISMTITIIIFFLQRPIIKVCFGTVTDNVMNASLIYLSISLLSYPFIALYNVGAALFRSMGNSRISMYVSTIMNVINVVGNAICIYGLNMGVAGVALPSLISRIFAGVTILILLNSKNNLVYIIYRLKEFKPDLKFIKKILYIAVPSALENSMFQFGKLLVMNIVASFGSTQIAANAVANNFSSVGCIPGAAMGLAIITVIGQCVGAKDYEQTKYYAKKLMTITYIASALTNITIILTLQWTINIYQLSSETLELAKILIYIHTGCGIVIWPMSFTLPNILRAANDVKYTMKVSILSMWIFRVIFSYILAKYMSFGVIGVWVSMIIDWIFRGIGFVYRLIGSKKWEKFAFGKMISSK